MKYAVLTFGCRVNQADSLQFEEQFRSHGASASDLAEADVVVVNTCSVTASSDQAARQGIRRVARLNPAARIVVTGCYATRKPDDLAALPGVVCVTPNDRKDAVVPLLIRGVPRRSAAAPDHAIGPDANLTTAERFGEGDGGCGAAIEPGTAGRTAFTLRVQTGCAQPCTYCIIPSTRGAPVSVPPVEIHRELERAVAAGYKEIVLTAVHLGSYGRDLVPPSSLVALLHSIASTLAGADVLIRISSLEPMDCSPEVIERVAATPLFAPHFHLPLQHASDVVLERMRRPYSRAYYERLVGLIRQRLPHASIGSDVIVGFPGERDEDFAALVSCLASSPLTHLHVFPYSDRPGTAASCLPGKVPAPVVRERARVVRDIGHRLTRRFHESQIGSVHRGLTLEDGTLVVTGNYLKVRIPPGRMRNEWVRVRVVTAGEPLGGELLTSSR